MLLLWRTSHQQLRIAVKSYDSLWKINSQNAKASQSQTLSLRSIREATVAVKADFPYWCQDNKYFESYWASEKASRLRPQSSPWMLTQLYQNLSTSQEVFSISYLNNWRQGVVTYVGTNKYLPFSVVLTTLNQEIRSFIGSLVKDKNVCHSVAELTFSRYKSQ